MKMNKLLVVVALVVASVNAHADQALAQKNGCLGCHSVEKKVLGPAFKDVAAKYKGQDVQAKLVEKVKKGGSGTWGPIPMPANSPVVSDKDIETLVKWVLTQ
jgi:cytochrome c